MDDNSQMIDQLPPPSGDLKLSDSLINNYFYEVDAGGGGDCLFRSLSYLLSGTPDHHDMVRLQICTYNLPEHIPVVEDERKAMCELGVWGTDLEVMIAAVIANRPIIVYMRNRNTGIDQVACAGSVHLNRILSGQIFRGVGKYLINPFYVPVAKRIYCIYLPDSNTDIEPLILYNIDQGHYRALKPKYDLIRYAMRSKRKSIRKRKSVRKSVRKSKSKRKSVRKSKSKRKNKSKRKSLRKRRV
jgi:hypothetical protein